jgi:hypothetical protein
MVLSYSRRSYEEVVWGQDVETLIRCHERTFETPDLRTKSEPSEVNGSPIPLHGCRRAGHRAFAAAAKDLSTRKKHLERAGVQIESEVAWSKSGRSIYLRDPAIFRDAGNSIALAMPDILGLK